MKIARLNGFEMAYRDEGNGLPVLLVHGFPLTSAMWNPQVVELKGDFRLIVPDLRGFGESAADLTTADSPRTLDDWADDLTALLDYLGLAKVVFMGFSMGGYIAFAFWRKYPDRVQAFGLCDTRSEADTPEGRAGRYKLIEAVEAKGADAAAEANVPKLFAPQTYQTKPELVAEVAGLIGRQKPSGIIAAAHAMTTRPDSTSDLAGITVPTLVVVGQHDGVTPVESARKMIALLPDWQLSIVPEAGHMANLENPAFFNRAVTTFLKELKG